jgi:hypothetical protein
MNDDLPCGTPFEQQASEDARTLEGMIDGMGLRAILMLLQGIAYEKAQHIEENWQDYKLAREWKVVGNRLGQWAKTLRNLH